MSPPIYDKSRHNAPQRNIDFDLDLFTNGPSKAKARLKQRGDNQNGEERKDDNQKRTQRVLVDCNITKIV